MLNGPRLNVASSKVLNRFTYEDLITVCAPARYYLLVGQFSSSLRKPDLQPHASGPLVATSGGRWVSPE